MIGQTVCVNGEACAAVQLVDLFILQAYRSGRLVRRLYKEVERLCTERNIRFILALPKDKSARWNARFDSIRRCFCLFAPGCRSEGTASRSCAIPACSHR
jgi:hypothetical protein